MKPEDQQRLPYRRGVGAILFNRAGDVFIGRRVDGATDAWQLPQGGINKREKPRQAVFRELAEEIGTDRAEILARSADWLRYDLPSELVGKVWGGKYRGQEQRWFALRFIGTDTDIDLNGNRHPEFDAWRWACFEELPKMAISFKRRLYHDLVDEFGELAEQLRRGTDGWR